MCQSTSKFGNYLLYIHVYNTIHNHLFQHDLSNHSTSADVVICYDVDILPSLTSKFYADSHREKNQWISAGPYEKTIPG